MSDAGTPLPHASTMYLKGESQVLLPNGAEIHPMLSVLHDEVGKFLGVFSWEFD